MLVNQTSARILLTAIALGATTTVHSATDDAKLHSDLERVAHKRILFGHQSVGLNIIEGIQQLSAKTGVPVNLTEVKSANEVKPATFGHTFIAENEKPFMKLDSLEKAMGTHATNLDIAITKFCFVDFTPQTDAKALFASYQSTIKDLEARNPGTTFVHVTAPLTSDKGFLKEFVKRLLGRSDSATNARREEYNSLLRRTYQGREPIFDLAHIESTAPDGRPVMVEWNNKMVPSMDPEYTDDGGHLNSVGKMRAAREFISVLASIPDRSASHKKTH